MVHILVAHSEEVPRCVHNAPAWVEVDRGVLEQYWHDWQAWCKGSLGKGEQAMGVLGGAFRGYNEQRIPAEWHFIAVKTAD